MAEHVTVAVAAERLAVCRRTIERRIQTGQIAAVDVNTGGRRPSWRIPVREIERLTFTPPAVVAERAAAVVVDVEPRAVEVSSGRPFQVRSRRAA